jgi:hypothetical protein
VLRPTAAVGAGFTEVGSADVRSQLTIQRAPFIRKSSVWMAHRGSGPGRVSRIIDAAARRSQSSTRHLSDGFMPDPPWSAPDSFSQSGTPAVELVFPQPRPWCGGRHRQLDLMRYLSDSGRPAPEVRACLPAGTGFAPLAPCPMGYAPPAPAGGYSLDVHLPVIRTSHRPGWMGEHPAVSPLSGRRRNGRDPGPIPPARGPRRRSLVLRIDSSPAPRRRRCM